MKSSQNKRSTTLATSLAAAVETRKPAPGYVDLATFGLPKKRLMTSRWRTARVEVVEIVGDAW